MAFTPTTQTPGNLIRSADWNEAMEEIVRLERDKVNKAGDIMTGPLTIEASAENPTAVLQVGNRLTLDHSPTTNFIGCNIKLDENDPTQFLRTQDGGASLIDFGNEGGMISMGAVGWNNADTPTEFNSQLTINGSGVGIGMVPGFGFGFTQEQSFGPGTLKVNGSIMSQNIWATHKLYLGLGGGMGGADYNTMYFFRGFTPDVPDLPNQAGNERNQLRLNMATRLEGAPQPIYTFSIGNYSIGNGTFGASYFDRRFAIGSNGNAYIAGNLTANNVSSGSDLRFKTEIIPLSPKKNLQKILKIAGISYRRKDLGKEQNRQLGFLAQDLEKIFPELVREDEDGLKYLNYSGLIPPMIETIKEQYWVIDTIKKEVDVLSIAMKKLQNNEEGTDFAEFLESKDGKAIPIGTSVVLDNGKIRKAKKTEIPIGVISENPGMVQGNFREWPKKQIKDDFGKAIYEEIKEEIFVPKTKVVKIEVPKTKKEKVRRENERSMIVYEKRKYIRKAVVETEDNEIEVPEYKEVKLYASDGKTVIGKHKVPVMKKVEQEIEVADENGQPVMVGSGKFRTVVKPKINPEYDPSRSYIPRSERPEWHKVGLLGQIPLKKGQPVAPTWVKIKDISDEVELWLIK